MTLLEEIDLTNNSLSGNLPTDPCTNNQFKLTGLFLSYNHMQGAIPSELYKCRDLEFLSLGRNQFNGNIPRTLGFLTKLKWLFIGGKIFSGIYWTPFFSATGAFSIQVYLTNCVIFPLLYAQVGFH